MAEKSRIKEYWFSGLISGVDQATDPDLVSNNESPLLKNVTLDQVGTWATRKGSSMLGDRITAADRVWGLFAYNSTADAHTLMMVTQRDLYAYNAGTTSWGLQESDTWTASKRVDGINFLNRLYLGCDDGTTALRYTTGTTTTAVVPTIGGAMLAVNKDILAVGGNNIKPNIIFYSNPFTQVFHKATGTCAADADVAGANTVTTTTGIFEADMFGSILYNTTEGVMATITDVKVAGAFTNTIVQTDTDTSTWNNDTVYVMKNNFKMDGACKGIVSYGENFVSFDEDNMYIWDPTSKYSRKLPNYGCVNYRTIQVVNGSLIWVNREGIYLWGGQGTPTAISAKITDDVNLFGIWNLLDDANWGAIASGVRSNEGLYVLSIGDLTAQTGAPASELTNTELCFDVNNGSWTVNSLADEPTVYCNWINGSGAKDLYMGCKGSSAVYKTKTGTTDALSGGTTQAISFDFRTPHHVLGDPRYANKVIKVWVKYTATNAVTMTMAADRGTYTTMATLPLSATVITKEIKARPNLWGFSHSLKFTGTGAFQLEAYGFEAEVGYTTRKVVL